MWSASFHLVSCTQDAVEAPQSNDRLVKIHVLRYIDNCLDRPEAHLPLRVKSRPPAACPFTSAVER